MSLQEEVDLLRRVPLFAKIEPAKLKLLAFTSERLVFAPNDVVFEQG
ncbi:MAG: cyclic nucleotide-binding protein, partial [Gammaproteobacteria bacterium]|nr:cyclic nucleotide-binding protein [Gammaproteobacteria bacterium]